jgi:hypothetical protein
MRAVLLSLCLLVLVFTVDAPHRPAATKPSASWIATVQSNLAHQEYFVSGESPQAPNRAQGIRTYFGAQGVRIIPREQRAAPWEGTLTLERFGSEDRLEAAPTARRAIQNNHVSYRRGTLTEWYVNDEHGLEQGFTLAQAPAGNQHLELDLALGGTLEARVSNDAKEVCFVDTHGTPMLRLGVLRAKDSRGDDLASHFALADNGQGLAIDVDATRAAYPVTIDPLLTSPSWLKESNLASADLGLSVATAGDVNGDGYSDVIVGALNYDTGDPNGGQVTVYYGSATGLSTTPSWSAKDAGGNGFGYKVGTAGDVNGDGYSDILVGAPLTNANHGELYVWYGSASGLGANGTTTNAAWKVAGPLAGDELGIAAGCAGDINNDGYSDLIVGAPDHDTGGGVHPGKALVFLGSNSGLSSTVFKEIDGTGDAYVGNSVATAGDVNADGYSDIVVGASGATGTAAQSGLAYVYYGPNLLDASRTTLDAGSANASFGSSVATAGDVNGDGYSDVIIGSPGYDVPTTDVGAIYVYKGGASGIATSYTWRFVGTSSGQRFGASVATAGDVDGDGYADVIAGWPLYTSGQTNEGAVCGFYGSSGGLKPSGLATDADWLYQSNNVGANFGNSVATAGDVNGDGFSDIIVGAPGYTNGQASEGAGYVFYGSPTRPTATGWAAEGTQAGEEFGEAVASGDFNGDGCSDIAIGCPYYDNGTTSEGAVFVYNGQVNGIAASPSWELFGDQFKGFVGISLANAGDVNGDGYDDLLVGASGYSEGGLTGEGHAFVFYGSPTGLAGAPNATLANAAWVARGGTNNGRFANAVSGAGDVNGDGYADVIIGEAFYANGQVDEGGAFVFYGSASGLPPNASPATASWHAESNQAGAELGSSVACAGDVNGDGYSDIIVGAPTYTGTFAQEGAVYLWHGSATGLGANGTPANAAWSVLGTATGEDWGRSVNTAGDMNGDGYSEIIIGAPKNGATQSGVADIYRGSSTVPTFFAGYSGPNAHAGTTVGPAGDLNGDGYADAIISEPTYSMPDTNEGAVLVVYGGPSGNGVSLLESGIANFQMGVPATAGDVNGDGYADLIVGIPVANNLEGEAWVYFGGSGRLSQQVLPRQRRKFSTSPIARLGMADSYREFIVTHRLYSPFGRSLVYPEYEVKPANQPFNGTGTILGGPANLVTDPNSARSADLQPLTPGTLYKWRVRFRYDKARQPFQVASKWFTMPADGGEDVRMLPASVVSAPPVVANNVQLEGGTPNPFVRSTTLRYSLPYAMPVRLAIYDARGRLVRELMRAPSEPSGWHSAAWDGANAGGRRALSGTYFARLETPKSLTTRQVVLER